MNRRMNIRLLMAMAAVIAMFAAVGFSATLDPGINGGAELDDITTIAEETGITVQEAVNWYGWHNDFARMVSEIRAASPGELTMAEITGDASASVYFEGETPGSALALVDAFEDNFPTVRVTTHANMGFTEEEVHAALVGAHYAVFRTAGVLDAASSFDHETMRIDIVAQTGGAPWDPTEDGLRRIAEVGVRDATRPNLLDMVSVNVTLVGHLVSGTSHDP